MGFIEINVTLMKKCSKMIKKLFDIDEDESLENKPKERKLIFPHHKNLEFKCKLVDFERALLTFSTISRETWLLKYFFWIHLEHLIALAMLLKAFIDRVHKR